MANRPRAGTSATNRQPLVTLTEAGDSLLVQLSLAGCTAADVDVRVSDEAVIIRRHPADRSRPGTALDNRQAARIVGSSPRLHSCLALARQAAADDGNVIITGEAGTGKSLFARFIHEHSRRAGHSLVTIDCSAIPPGLPADRLAGWRLACGGRERVPASLFHQADQGTLFLEEISELPWELQLAIVRHLHQTHADCAGNGKAASKVRLMAASRHNLAEIADCGGFCRELLTVLQAWAIDLPPLRERSEDLAALSRHVIDDLCRRHRLSGKQMTPEFLLNITHYDWPGNVDELSDALEQAVFSEPTATTLFPKHLPVNVRVQAAKALFRARHAGSLMGKPRRDHLPRFQDLREHVFSNAEQQYLNNLITLTGRNIEQACALSGLSRSRLYTLLKKHQVTSH